MFDEGTLIMLFSALTTPQVGLHTAMLFLELVLDPSTWMMLVVLQLPASYWNVLAGHSYHITVFILLMLV